jgi:hypothetical protein
MRSRLALGSLMVLAFALPALAQTPAQRASARRTTWEWYTDFTSSVAQGTAPWHKQTVSGGVTSMYKGFANRPGIITTSSSATANSGEVIWVAMFSGILLAGEEYFAMDFRPEDIVNVTGRFGFHDTLTTAAVVDGVYIHMDTAGLVTGVTSDNGTSSTTGTSFQLTAGSFYRAEIELDAGATTATFTIKDDAGLTTFWTDALTTNIPTAPGRELGVGSIWTATGGARPIVSHDYIFATTGRTLVR